MTETATTPHWARLAVGAGAALFVGMGVGRFSYTPMVPALVADGGFSAAEAGTVGACNLAGFLVGALMQPALRRAWGEAAAQRLAIAVTLAALIASIAPWGFFWLASWRGLAGVGVGVIMVQSLAVATRWAPAGRLGAAAGIAFTGVGIGIVLSGVMLPALLDHGLTAAWAGLALIGALGSAVALWAWAPGVPAVPAPAAATGAAPAAGAQARLVLAHVMFTLGLIPHTIYWIDYLVRGLGHSAATGGGHWALFGLGAMTGPYLWGRLGDRIGRRAGLVAAFASLAVGTALPVLETAGWALVFSSLVVGAQPGCSALLSGRAHQIFGAAGMPAVWRRMVLASGIGQALGGYALVALFEWSGGYAAVFGVGATAFTLGAVAAAGLGRRTG